MALEWCCSVIRLRVMHMWPAVSLGGAIEGVTLILKLEDRTEIYPLAAGGHQKVPVEKLASVSDTVVHGSRCPDLQRWS